jgi:uncharacterized protein YqiB (DUF1249 family)
MLVDSYILPDCIAKPRSFGGLMALYEANFLKVRQLIGGLDSRTGRAVSYSESDCNLHLSIEVRSKYTCELRLTYLFADAGGTQADPDLLAKVYFDARMAEVRSWADDHQHQLLQALNQRFMNGVDQCWSRNMMFSKWLDYLLEQGHRFPAGSRTQPVNALLTDSLNR